MRLWRRRTAPAPLRYDPDDPGLIVIIEAFEAARADSAVLAGSGVDLDQPMLVRHHLVGLPDAAAVGRAEVLLAQEDYVVRPGPGAPISVLACRTQLLTALSLSQERSRMAGLAQRLGGDVRGWDALTPDPPRPR